MEYDSARKAVSCTVHDALKRGVTIRVEFTVQVKKVSGGGTNVLEGDRKERRFVYVSVFVFVLVRYDPLLGC